MNIDATSLIIGIGLGGFGFYTLMKFKLIDIRLRKLTPEAIAKEVIKVKIPLSEMPPEMMEDIKNMRMGAPPGMPPGGPKQVPKDIFDKGDKKSEYIG